MIQKSYKAVIGIFSVLFLNYALITDNQDLLLLPIVQMIMGLVSATMLVAGIAAFRNKNKKIGSFYACVSLFVLIVMIFNNTMTIDGLIPVAVIYIVGGVPIGIIAMFAIRLENRGKL